VKVAFLDFLGGTGGGHVAWADSVATLAVVPLVLWERATSHAAHAMQVFLELSPRFPWGGSEGVRQKARNWLVFCDRIFVEGWLAQ
jgi:hypothetical protein